MDNICSKKMQKEDGGAGDRNLDFSQSFDLMQSEALYVVKVSIYINVMNSFSIDPGV
jgi:hypothetical protein